MRSWQSVHHRSGVHDDNAEESAGFGCFDALCHNIEAYTSRIAQPFTDALSLYAIDLIAHNLVDVYNGTAGKEGWEKITLASTIGGMVINTAGVTLAHGWNIRQAA